MNLFETSFGGLRKRYGIIAAIWLWWYLHPYGMINGFYIASRKRPVEIWQFTKIMGHETNIFTKPIVFSLSSCIWDISFQIGLSSNNKETRNMIERVFVDGKHKQKH